MKADVLFKMLEELAPAALALSWDNPGLICGRRDREIRKVLLALDASEPVVDRAIAEDCDLVLTHHPMIFKAIPKVNSDTALGRKLMKLIQKDICCYAMHTNFDAAPGCMADLVCEGLGMEKEGPLEPSVQENGLPSTYGIGFVGSFEGKMSCREVAELLRERFDLKGLTYYDTGRPIGRAAVCPGSGHGMLQLAAAHSVDALITGDMGHHDGLDALEAGISLIDAGHFGLEHIFVPFMKDYLQRNAPELEIITDLTDCRSFLS